MCEVIATCAISVCVRKYSAGPDGGVHYTVATMHIITFNLPVQIEPEDGFPDERFKSYTRV